MLLFIKRLIIKIKRLFFVQRRRTAFLKVLYIDDTIEDIPGNLKEETLYVIHGSGKPKWVKFICPCGCGQEICLNLMKSYSPYWSIKKETDGSMTVSPSVNIIEGCKSHFFIKSNKIDWCG